MTAALYLLAEGTLSAVAAGDVVVLDGPEGHHAATVKRARVGEPLLVADGSGRLGEGDVVAVGAGTVSVRLAAVRTAATPAPRFVLAQALAKGGRDEQALEAATELGVDEVLAWQADRSIVRWRADKAAKALGKWADLTRAASKQSRRATVPAVAGPLTTRALAARAGEIVAAGGLALVLHEDATTPLAGLALPETGDVLLIVGPEGGIGDDELAQLTDIGATPVRLGSTVLRSSSAGPAALAVLSAASRWR